MNQTQRNRQRNTQSRKARIRAKISGTATMPRLSIFRSNRGVYVQLIDDTTSHTVASVAMKELTSATKIEMSSAAGKRIAEKALALGVVRAVFDRGGNQYHGRVKAIAEAAREAGLTI